MVRKDAKTGQEEAPESKDAQAEVAIVPTGPQLRAFRDALGRFATGVTIVTIPGKHGPIGFTANSFSSLSMDPPLILWAPARASARFELYSAAPHFAVHVLSQDQSDLIKNFHRGGDGFSAITHHHNAEDVPIFPRSLARFDCAQHATHDGGDHLIIVGRVLRFVTGTGAPLVFAQGRYGGFVPGK